MSAKDNQFLAQNWSILEQNLEFLFTWKEYCCALETLSKLTFFSYLTTPPKTPIVNYSFLSLKSSLNNPLNRTYILSPSGQVHAAMTFVGSLTPDCKTLELITGRFFACKESECGTKFRWWMADAAAGICLLRRREQAATNITHPLILAHWSPPRVAGMPHNSKDTVRKKHTWVEIAEKHSWNNILEYRLLNKSLGKHSFSSIDHWKTLLEKHSFSGRDGWETLLAKHSWVERLLENTLGRTLLSRDIVEKHSWKNSFE